MILEKIELHHFRNLSHQSVVLNPNKNYFIGDNAQGKTNFLEAVFFLSRGKSFRPGENESLIYTDFLQQQKSDLARVNGFFRHKNFDYQVMVKLHHKRKEFLLNQKKATPSQLLNLVPMILFSPESLSVIKESAEQRRNLV